MKPMKSIWGRGFSVLPIDRKQAHGQIRGKKEPTKCPAMLTEFSQYQNQT